MSIFQKYFIPIVAFLLGLALLLVLPTLIGIAIFYPLGVIAEYISENHVRKFWALAALIGVCFYCFERWLTRKREK
jgi:cell division protein FtsW (lipid II flippase)